MGTHINEMDIGTLLGVANIDVTLPPSPTVWTNTDARGELPLTLPVNHDTAAATAGALDTAASFDGRALTVKPAAAAEVEGQQWCIAARDRAHVCVDFLCWLCTRWSMLTAWAPWSSSFRWLAPRLPSLWPPGRSARLCLLPVIS